MLCHSSAPQVVVVRLYLCECVCLVSLCPNIKQVSSHHLVTLLSSHLISHLILSHCKSTTSTRSPHMERSG